MKNDNSLAVFIAGTKVTCNEDGLYSLNDLHKASGGEKRHEPNRWLRLTSTQEVIKEMEESDAQIWVSKKGGTDQGTYVDKILLGMYASWISPKFHIMVYRVFFEAMEEKLKTLEDEKAKLTDFKDDFYRKQIANNMLAKDYSKFDRDVIKGIKIVVNSLKYNKEISYQDIFSMGPIYGKPAQTAVDYVMRNVVECVNPSAPLDKRRYVAKAQ